MRYFLSILLFFFGCSPKVETKKSSIPLITNNLPQTEMLADSTNTLNGKIRTLELAYIIWGCECANWIPLKEKVKYEKKGGLAENCIFIEAADSSLELPTSFEPAKHTIRVSGQFYVKKDYPKGMEKSEEKVEKAKVFRYNALEIISKPH